MDLSHEVLKLKAEMQELQNKLKGAGPEASTRDLQQQLARSQSQLTYERKKFRNLASLMTQELEYLKTVFPFEKLLEAKDLEVKRLLSAYKKLDPKHSDYDSIQQILKAHMQNLEFAVNKVETQPLSHFALSEKSIM